jgi:hypothetical protein
MPIMNVSNPPPGKMSILRRSQRMHIGVDIVVAARRESDEPLTEVTKTLIISANGALIPLRMIVAVGEILTLRNLQTREELYCRVVDLESSSESEMTEVGVEFIESTPNFWRVSFPPACWTSRDAEAKSYVPRTTPPVIPTKKR